MSLGPCLAMYFTLSMSLFLITSWAIISLNRIELPFTIPELVRTWAQSLETVGLDSLGRELLLCS